MKFQMELESDRYNIWKNRDLFGIYDLQINTWILDCFDYPQLFFTRKHAEEYRTKCIDYNCDRYEVRQWSKMRNIDYESKIT